MKETKVDEMSEIMSTPDMEYNIDTLYDKCYEKNVIGTGKRDGSIGDALYQYFEANYVVLNSFLRFITEQGFDVSKLEGETKYDKVMYFVDCCNNRDDTENLCLKYVEETDECYNFREFFNENYW